jgi:hypothetical protein
MWSPSGEQEKLKRQKLHFYLDVWLLRNASKDILKAQMKLLIKNVKLAGWIMNEE